MENNEVINLVAITKAIDSYGDMTETESKTQVFARLKSVGMSEFYQANATGFKPEIKFIVSDWLDYNGERIVEWDGLRFDVIRVYRNGLEVELTCQQGVYREPATEDPEPDPTPDPEP